MGRTVEFYEFEEARRSAGTFFARMLDELDLNQRTYRRWKKRGTAPLWAFNMVVLLGGELPRHGWPHWSLENGVLYNDQLNRRYHHWTPGTLLGDL
jgi:hypothetical protein